MQVTTKDVSMIVNDLPTGKSSGFDGLNSERLKHADPLVGQTPNTNVILLCYHITVNLFYMYVYTLLYAIFYD